MPVFSRVVNLEHQLQIPQDVPKGDKASKKQLGLKPYKFLGSLLPSVFRPGKGQVTGLPKQQQLLLLGQGHLAGILRFCHSVSQTERVFLLKVGFSTCQKQRSTYSLARSATPA